MSELTLRFWGTRGSIPTPGRQTEKYGGNTTCLEVRHGETVIVIDAGSGIRQLSDAWFAEFGDRPISANLLFTHAHWDHIQGFPFFGPGYVPGNRFDIYGDRKPSGGIAELLGGQMGGAYFPIPLTAMKAELNFRYTDGDFPVGSVRLTTRQLPHPGGCLGFRFETAGATLVLATDCELDLVALNREAVRADHGIARQYEPEFLRFFTGADVLVIDCQYTDEEYSGKVGWGHNSLTTVADLCRQVKPRLVLLTHHDPRSDDRKVDEMVHTVSQRLAATNGDATLISAARERMKVRVGQPIPAAP